MINAVNDTLDLSPGFFDWAMETLVPFKVDDYIDVHLMKWLIWLFTPIVVRCHTNSYCTVDLLKTN